MKRFFCAIVLLTAFLALAAPPDPIVRNPIDTVAPGPMTNIVKAIAAEMAATNATLNLPDFTIVQMGDLQNCALTATGREYVTNSFSYLIAMKSALNIKALVLPGDLTDDGTDETYWLFITNQLARLYAAGIPFYASAGNHDKYGGNHNAWNNHMAAFMAAQPGYESKLSAADYYGTSWFQTNSGLKLNFIALGYATNATDFANIAAFGVATSSNNADHISIFLTHGYLSTDSIPLFTPDTGYDSGINGIDWWSNCFKIIPSSAQVLCGHDHPGAFARLTQFNDWGTRVDSVLFNEQDSANGGGNFIRFYRWMPNHNWILAYTVNSVNTNVLTTAGSYFVLPITGVYPGGDFATTNTLNVVSNYLQTQIDGIIVGGTTSNTVANLGFLGWTDTTNAVRGIISFTTNQSITTPTLKGDITIDRYGALDNAYLSLTDDGAGSGTLTIDGDATPLLLLNGSVVVSNQIGTGVPLRVNAPAGQSVSLLQLDLNGANKFSISPSGLIKTEATLELDGLIGSSAGPIAVLDSLTHQLGVGTGVTITNDKVYASDFITPFGGNGFIGKIATGSTNASGSPVAFQSDIVPGSGIATNAGTGINNTLSNLTAVGFTANTMTNTGLTGQGVIGTDANGKFIAGSATGSGIITNAGTGIANTLSNLTVWNGTNHGVRYYDGTDNFEGATRFWTGSFVGTNGLFYPDPGDTNALRLSGGLQATFFETPTNTPTDAYVLTATGTAGKTAWKVAASGGGIQTNSGTGINNTLSNLTAVGFTANTMTNTGLTGQAVIGTDANGKLIAGSATGSGMITNGGTGINNMFTNATLVDPTNIGTMTVDSLVINTDVSFANQIDRTNIAWTVKADVTGATDATTAITNMLNAATGSNTVYLPPGKYAISDNIHIPSGVKLIGGGTKNSSATILSGGCVIFDGVGSWLEGVKILPPANSYGIQLLGAQGAGKTDNHIKNCRVVGTGKAGVRGLIANWAWNNPIEETYFDEMNYGIIYSNNVNTSPVKDCHFGNITNEAVLVQGGSCWNNKFEDCIIEVALGGIDNNNVATPEIVNCYFNTVTNAIVLTNTQSAIVSGNSFVNVWGTNILCGGTTSWRPSFENNKFEDQNGNARNFVVFSDTVVPWFHGNSRGTVLNADVVPTDSFVYGPAGVQTRATTTATLTNTGVAYFGSAGQTTIAADGTITGVAPWSFQKGTAGLTNFPWGVQFGSSVLTNWAANTATNLAWATGLPVSGLANTWGLQTGSSVLTNWAANTTTNLAWATGLPVSGLANTWGLQTGSSGLTNFPWGVQFGSSVLTNWAANTATNLAWATGLPVSGLANTWGLQTGSSVLTNWAANTATNLAWATGLPVSGLASTWGLQTGSGVLTNLATCDETTNLFSGVSFLLGQYSFTTCNSNIYINTVSSSPTSTKRYGTMDILPTGDITLTNAIPINASDGVKTRTLTNGTFYSLLMTVHPGRYTNLYIGWTK